MDSSSYIFTRGGVANKFVPAGSEILRDRTRHRTPICFCKHWGLPKVIIKIH